MELFALFVKGGLVMYPLLVCSIIAVCILIERLRVYGRSHTNVEELQAQLHTLVPARDWEGVKKACEADGGVAAAMIAYASRGGDNAAQQEKLMEAAAIAESAGLRRYLNYLETIVTLAPLLGLLGTVTGMIGSFSVLAVAEGQPFAITGGVGEALIATASGLLVAILALLIHTFLVQRQDTLIAEMENMSTAYVADLAEGK